MTRALRTAVLFPVLALSCKPPPQPSQPPQPQPQPATQPEPQPQPAPAPASASTPKAESPAKVPTDAIAVGTFNLEWAFDDLDRRPKKARPHAAKTPEDWTWKRDRLVEMLVAERLDVVTLSELGGERELLDITAEIRDKGGPDYETAWIAGEDRATGQHVAVLSRLPLSNVRRYDVDIAKHVAVDVELPTGGPITVVALHMRDGQAPAYAAKRRRAARALSKIVRQERRNHPVLVVGTLNSKSHPYDDDYPKQTPGLLASRHTRSDEDDCFDSATETGPTTAAGDALDRVISCGLELRSATVARENEIVRDERDPSDVPWTSIPIEAAPFRDVSDHFVVWAEIAVPKPSPQPENETPRPTTK